MREFISFLYLSQLRRWTSSPAINIYHPVQEAIYPASSLHYMCYLVQLAIGLWVDVAASGSQQHWSWPYVSEVNFEPNPGVSVL
jgi:hypothetical protein